MKLIGKQFTENDLMIQACQMGRHGFFIGMIITGLKRPSIALQQTVGLSIIQPYAWNVPAVNKGIVRNFNPFFGRILLLLVLYFSA
jgi:hypothetical protein